MNEMGKVLVVVGIVFIAIGIVMMYSKGSIPRLPGDVYFKKDGFSFYFPIMTSIIISIILTIVFRLFNK